MAIAGMNLTLLILAAAVVTGSILLSSAAAGWHRATRRKVALLVSRESAVPGAFSTSDIDRLPPPVARYFRRALTDGQPLVVSARATQEGAFFVKNAWRPMHATQDFTTSPPGFVWDARIEMMPFMPAYVRDAYVGRRGAMQATMFGFYPLMNQEGVPQLNAGALQRYLGEAVWMPTALLPGCGVTWTAIDQTSATATLADGPNRVSLRFIFNDRDQIVEVRGDRFAESNGRYVLTPWRVQCFEHAERSGMMIPLSCEAAWLSAEGAKPYWRGRISAISYKFN